MIDEIRDRLEEGKGIPVQYSNKAREIFSKDDSHFDEMEWNGILGTRKGQMGVHTILHQTNHSDEVITKTSLLFERLKEIEQEKDLALFNVKRIGYKLSKLKTEKQKQTYLNSENTQEIFERYEVNDYPELQQKISALSAAITEVRNQLEFLGMQFGANPDNAIFFPLSQNCDSGFMMDYRAILQVISPRKPGHQDYATMPNSRGV